MSIIFITVSIITSLSEAFFNSKFNFLFTKFKFAAFTSSNASTFWPITSAQCAQFRPPSIILTFLSPSSAFPCNFLFVLFAGFLVLICNEESIVFINEDNSFIIAPSSFDESIDKTNDLFEAFTLQDFTPGTFTAKISIISATSVVNDP